MTDKAFEKLVEELILKQIPKFQAQIDDHLTRICRIDEIRGCFRKKLDRNRLLKSQRA